MARLLKYCTIFFSEYSWRAVKMICKIFEICDRLEDETLDDDEVLSILRSELPEKVVTGL